MSEPVSKTDMLLSEEDRKTLLRRLLEPLSAEAFEAIVMLLGARQSQEEEEP
jgi:hypothetical protein